MSTTTTTKKKLIYRQDPDGIFRLKKIDNEELGQLKRKDNYRDEDYINDNYRVQAKPEVHQDNNELADCSYQLVDHRPVAAYAKNIPTSNSSMKIPRDSLKNYNIGTNEDRVVVESPPTSSSSSSIFDDSIQSQTTNFSRIKSASHPKSNHKHTIPEIKITPSSIAETESIFSNKPIYSTNMFHLPSFLVGILITTYGFFFKQQLFQMVGVLVILFILITIIGLIFGGVGWYQNVLLSYLSIIKAQFGFFPTTTTIPEKAPMVLDPNQNDLPSINEYEYESEEEESLHSRETRETRDTRETRPTRDTDKFRNYQLNSPIIKPQPLHPQFNRSPSPSASSPPYPPQETVEMKLIMHPPRTDNYIPQPHGKDIIPKSRHHNKLSVSSSSPNLYQSQKQPKLARLNTDRINQRNVEGSLPLPEPGYSPTREFPKIIKVHSGPHKELPNPPIQHDLPLVNPLPRSRHQSFDDYQYNTEMQRNPRTSDNQYNGLSRNGTVKSSKSVLGTRANYSKFLANANEQSTF